MRTKKTLLSDFKAAVIDRAAAKTVVGGWYCAWAGHSGRLPCTGTVQACTVSWPQMGGKCLWCPGTSGQPGASSLCID
jgi:hypothetical protein